MLLSSTLIIWATFLTSSSYATYWTVPEMTVDEEKGGLSTHPISITDTLKVVSGRGDTTDPSSDALHETELNDPYFDAGMVNIYTAYLGKAAIMTCIVHDVKNDKSVSWIRTRDIRILAAGRYTYASDLRFEAMHSEGSKEWILRIRSVQLRDAGNYECQINTKPIKSFNVFLKVVEPTVEILGAPDIFVNRASMINLTCIVHHAPNPPEEIEWLHGNETISYTSARGGVSVVEERGETTTSFLLLQNARKSDTGSFTCQPSGMPPTKISLHVLEEGEQPEAMKTNSCPSFSKSKIRLYIFLIFFFTVLQVNIS